MSDNKKEGMSRRLFIKTGVAVAGAAYAGAIGYPIYKYLTTPASREAEMGAVSEVALEGANTLEPGSALMFKFGTRPAMLIHHQDDSWVALDAICTHLGCTVQYQPENKRIYCACHGGVYDPATGNNVSGPPPAPLKSYNVEVQDGQVLVSRA